ncbi:cation diffusion facilitator family transporter [Actinomyces culturomici]|uniref:cation diffusion facilitator family transporter n=1 Tax=Actinomyces culturomici TaxID=1926276 RepID=UPI000E200D33|nr:cation diffusion facilitator family transporter [Actinomyces culturomici]
MSDEYDGHDKLSGEHTHGGHSHAGHSHGAGASHTRLIVAFAITCGIVIAQLLGSWITGSLALLTDTAHAIVDASGLALALAASTIARRPATGARTWGLRRIEVIAALAQSILLIVVGVYTAVEGIARLADPPEIMGTELLVFGVIGMIANVASVAVLSGGRDASLNMRAAFLEVLNDALGSLGVIVAALAIRHTGFDRADAIAGLFIATLIVPRALTILRQTLAILMEFAPSGVDLEEVRGHILALEHVEDVHDLHASVIGTGLPIISAHVVVGENCFETTHALSILQEVRECVATHFPVAFEHSTIQLETASVHAAEPHCAVDA